MSAIKGTYQNGQVILKERADWPEGTEVLVEPVSVERSLGIRDEDWPTDPEGIARHLALMDRIEPLVMTPQEEADWEAARKAQKEHDLATSEERARRIERLFE
jgi:hypothetical protein